jgi:phosphoglycolate phosphatase-like HAD superfamily hydrolase
MTTDDHRSTRVVVFDCDGVMFDTENANRIYYNTILERFGRPPLDAEQFAYVHMSTVKEALAFLFRDETDLDPVYAFCRTMSYEPLIPHMEMEPHLMDLLARLKTRFNTAIATNRSNTMDAVMAHFKLAPWFDLVVTSQDVTHPKPHPEQLFKIMDYFNVTPEEVLYLGDSSTDERAARGAGVPFVSYGNPDLEARHHIRGLDEVFRLLGL